MGQIKKNKKINKQLAKNNTESLSEKYDRFSKINSDSESDDEKQKDNNKSNHQFHVVSPENETEWMREQGIVSYKKGKNNFNIGIGEPLTEKEFLEIKNSEKTMIT